MPMTLYQRNMSLSLSSCDIFVKSWFWCCFVFFFFSRRVGKHMQSKVKLCIVCEWIEQTDRTMQSIFFAFTLKVDLFEICVVFLMLCFLFHLRFSCDNDFFHIDERYLAWPTAFLKIFSPVNHPWWKQWFLLRPEMKAVKELTVRLHKIHRFSYV